MEIEPIRERGENAKAEEMRAEILEHAVGLFKHYGFSKTNIGDIAECCGMSAGNLYRYFRNKQAIGLACVEQHFQSEQSILLALEESPGGAPEDRIRNWLVSAVKHMVAECEQHPKIVELAEFLMEDDDGWALLQDHIQWKRRHLALEIRRGIEAGALAPCDAEETAKAVLMALKAFWMPITLARWRDRSTIMPELNAILDLIMRGLRAR
ncbi:MAG: TetR/AcrR family transcriptional regulator [Pseudomonadota bacterium]